MKKLMLLFSLLAFTVACSSDDEISATTNEGTLFFTSYEKYKLSTGEEQERKIKVAAIMIWNADGKDFDFVKSNSDILKGFVWDNISNQSYKYNYVTMYTDTYSLKLKPGKYAIFVQYDKDKGYDQSYTHFEVKSGEMTDLKKYHKSQPIGSYYAPW